MSLPTLYKHKGKKILEWNIEVNHYNDYSEYTISFGQQGGKRQSTSTAIREGKNLGKANETTIAEQCEAEAKALWQKQIDRKGYFEYLGGLMHCLVEEKMPSPMLALEYDKFAHKVVFPCYIQPKLDGVRCLAYLRNDKVVLLSRQRKEFNHLDHIKAGLLPLFKENPDLVLDGELYSHQYTFQEIISAIKRDEPNKLTQNVEYHIYDLVSNKGFEDRLNDIFNIVVPILKKNDNTFIQNLFTEKVYHEAEIQMAHGRWTSMGYEGAMVRNSAGGYKQDGRSQDLLKYKKFLDMEFPIVGADQNKGKLANTCTFRCTHNGTEFNVMPEGTQEEREQMYIDWKDGAIKAGDLLTVKFFSWTNSEKPVPRFPIGRFKYNT